MRVDPKTIFLVLLLCLFGSLGVSAAADDLKLVYFFTKDNSGSGFPYSKTSNALIISSEGWRTPYGISANLGDKQSIKAFLTSYLGTADLPKVMDAYTGKSVDLSKLQPPISVALIKRPFNDYIDPHSFLYWLSYSVFHVGIDKENPGQFSIPLKLGEYGREELFLLKSTREEIQKESRVIPEGKTLNCKVESMHAIYPGACTRNPSSEQCKENRKVVHTSKSTVPFKGGKAKTSIHMFELEIVDASDLNFSELSLVPNILEIKDYFGRYSQPVGWGLPDNPILNAATEVYSSTRHVEHKDFDEYRTFSCEVEYK